ncbi:MAG: NAD(P)-binding protein, partial [Lysobacterales bacterium]
MKFRNADHLGENESLQTDICIVGAGAAGITLALELEQSRHRVMLLESGDAEPLVAADRLNDIEIAGHPLHVDGPVRRRCFGGTTNSTFGRSVLLDAIDFESRPWLGVDGWPLAEAELRRFYPRTAEILGLPKPEWLHRERWSGYPLVHDISTHD